MNRLATTRILGLTFAAWVLACAVFAGLYVYRAELYAMTEVVPASMAELYPVSRNTLAITHFQASGEQKLTLGLRNAAPCSQWQVSVKDGNAQTVSGANPAFTLTPGIHDYVIQPQNCTIGSPDIDAIRLNIFFGFSEDFTVQNVSTDQIQINGANIPIVLDEGERFARWIPDVKARAPGDAEEAARILKDAGFNPAWTTPRKIEFLVKLVRERMAGGAPAAYLNSITPLAVYKETSSGNAASFCRQWSLGYGYLANISGIPTRNLFTGGAMEGVDMGSHAFSESYIEEQARWAYVDPTNNIAYVTNPNGEVLNGAEIYLSSITANEQDLSARVVSDGTVVTAPYGQVSKDVRYFMHRENFLIYIGAYDGRYQLDGNGPSKYGKKLYRFLFQPQQYFGVTHFTSYPWLRPASFLLSLFTGLLFLTLLALRLLNRPHPSNTSTGEHS